MLYFFLFHKPIVHSFSFFFSISFMCVNSRFLGKETLLIQTYQPNYEPPIISV